MTIQEAIQKAVEGGWKPLSWFDPYTAESRGIMDDGHEVFAIYGTKGEKTTVNAYRTLLDPSFWQALCKSMGWDKGQKLKFSTQVVEGEKTTHLYSQKISVWEYYWHNLIIDHLAKEKSIEDYFKNL